MATAAPPEADYQKLVAGEATTEPPLAAVENPPATVVEDRAAIPPPPHEATTANPMTPDPMVMTKTSHDRVVKVEDEKRLSFIKAWEYSEKSKVENKAQKKFCKVSSWENSKKASLEAQLMKIEEQLEKKKAGYAEKIRNKIALIRKGAEEKRAMIEARRGEELLKAEEMAAKYRATGHAPKQRFGCFGC